MNIKKETAAVGRPAMTVRETTLCGLCAVLIAVGAFIKISIPIQPFPMHFTLQFFFVLLAGLLLGGRMGLYSVCTYLVIGLLGFPVFAAGGGLSYLLRPTFGFLLGFAGAAWTAGTLLRRTRRRSWFSYFAASTCGMLVYYLCGMVYFYVVSNYLISMPVTWAVVFVNCFLLTAGGDWFLCAMAALLARRVAELLPELKR